MAGRGTAGQRRAQIRLAAAVAFATAGLHGVSVDTIAGEVGISEAYVFRLFGTKRELFVDVVTSAFDTMTAAMVAAAGDAEGVEALVRMGEEYNAFLAADRNRLLLQKQGFAACADPVVQEAVRNAFGRLWSAIAEVSGLEPLQVKTFMAIGMLLGDLAALELDDLGTTWAQQATTPVPRALYTFPTDGHS